MNGCSAEWRAVSHLLFESGPDEWTCRPRGLAKLCRGLIGGQRGPGLEMYVFGKHPAWRDYIDPSLLPPRPRAFTDFHRRLRPVVEAAYLTPDAKPRLLFWSERNVSAALIAAPSRDALDTETGAHRFAALLLGASARSSPRRFFEFIIPRLKEAVERLQEPNRSADDVVSFVWRSQQSWNRQWLVCDTSLARSRYEGTWPRRDFTMAADVNLCPLRSIDAGPAVLDPRILHAAFPVLIRPDDVQPLDTTHEANSTKRGESARSTPLFFERLPNAQRAYAGVPLVFSSHGGNSIELGMWNGDESMQITLRAHQGSIWLGHCDGMEMLIGDGLSERSLIQFHARPTIANSVLDGLQFTPSAGYVGRARLQIRVLRRTSRDDASFADASLEIDVTDPSRF